MRVPRFVWTLIGIGGAVGVAYWLWSKREIRATVTVPEEEIRIGPLRTTEDAFNDLLRSQGLEAA